IVLAVPKEWKDVKSITSLIKRGIQKKELRIATEYLNLASKLVSSNDLYKQHYENKKPTIITPWWRKGDNSEVKIILSFGATEAKPPRDADAILDNTETGTTLEKNNLRIIQKIMKSTSSLIANPLALKDPDKREKILDVLTLLLGVVEAKKKTHIFANVEEKNLDTVLKLLPALKSPTVTPLGEKGWYSVNTVIDRKLLVELTPKLRKYVQGIVVHEPRQILPYIDPKKVKF
ncbi:MAG: ATP phosphoribosyltransferase, partial [Candidatus Ranarchaeia archaeon]